MDKQNNNAISLLKTARGQISGIINMIESNRFCVDISRQVLAVEALVRKANLCVLKKHIDSCVKDAFREGASEKQAEEVVRVIDKYLK